MEHLLSYVSLDFEGRRDDVVFLGEKLVSEVEPLDLLKGGELVISRLGVHVLDNLLLESLVLKGLLLSNFISFGEIFELDEIGDYDSDQCML